MNVGGAVWLTNETISACSVWDVKLTLSIIAKDKGNVSVGHSSTPHGMMKM